MSTSPSRTAARLVAAATTAALTLTLAPTVSSAATTTAPTSSSTSGDGIRDRQLDRLIEKVHDAGAVGVTAELRTPDGTWRGAAGDGELEPRVKASRSARFRAASVSKMLVTTLAMQQVERGRWTLDTTLGDALPGVWPELDDVTLRQLLGHTSGLPDYLTSLVATADTTPKFRAIISQRRTDAELIGVARTLPTTPRDAFAYSNTNFVLVGMMLEKATGRSLKTLVERRVLAPSRMTQSSWPTTARMPRPRLKEYAYLYEKVEDLSTFEPSMFSGAGALLTTARDLNRFQRALSRGDLVDRSLVRQMRSVASDGGGTGLEWGLGSYRLPDPCDPGAFVYGHDGGSWSTLTVSYASPKGDRRVAVSMTGRDYDGKTAANQAMLKLAFTALAQTCGGKPVAAAEAPDVAKLAAAS
ncbi:serine hydrolase domain-containing protein [Solicola sp. PLA-1-18]|uniref:serine hydrolase domain-containing protein n=1 Tax=Solicola sp. PLA-1-18 TaxID=3380532 RepID=UPI003B76624D